MKKSEVESITCTTPGKRRRSAYQFTLWDAAESLTRGSLAVGILGLIQGEGTALMQV